MSTGRLYRTVDLLDVLAGNLASYLASCTASSQASGRDSLLFARADGWPWRLDDWNNRRNRRFLPAAKRAGLGRPRPYDLRHSFASLMVREQRTSVVELAEQLGHAPTMTLNTYAHVFAEHRRAEPVESLQRPVCWCLVCARPPAHTMSSLMGVRVVGPNPGRAEVEQAEVARRSRGEAVGGQEKGAKPKQQRAARADSVRA